MLWDPRSDGVAIKNVDNVWLQIMTIISELQDKCTHLWKLKVCKTMLFT